jgi:DNA helicase II / ATP-dependent DNA helicase PcrA
MHMRHISDFHIHSRFSRACSKGLTLPSIAATCTIRGIDLVATGDFTHPAWRKEIGEQLEESQEGIFQLRSANASIKTQFILGTELSCIAKHKGATRRVHLLVLAPSFAAVDRFIASLDAQGRNLASDGRPILGMTAKQLLELALGADDRMLVIPAHAWTPWFAIFGSKSGYDSIEECFEDLSSHILAIETGLSSDPSMNWRCSMLDDVALISSSDAHSLQKLGREATVLELSECSFDSVSDALWNSAPVRWSAAHANRIVRTIEFHPEEGKYHVDGHRSCRVRCTPLETKKMNGICPQCGKPMTVGVLHRVDKLADRDEGFVHANAPPFMSSVPLLEVIAEALGVRSVTKRVQAEYDALTRRVGNEFYILLDAPHDVIASVARPEVAEAVRRVRAGALHIEPGYDGEFGTVRIFSEEHPRPVGTQRALL